MTPRATYRFQFHSGFTFADAEALVSYLDRLGISHVYASPVTTARSGSTHGYDVIDPTRVNPELGGEQGLRNLVSALRERGMGLIIDIVPNHMGVAGGENAWWNDVLQHGEASAYARFFDIDWSRKLLLPLLGSPLPAALAAGNIAIDVSGEAPMLLLYGDQRVPLRPEDHQSIRNHGNAIDLPALLERQHYQLAWWRAADDELNWRRFFTITELAGLRIEEPAVFEATHALYFRLYAEGLIDGVRIDHVDGLTDPGGYCRLLRERLGAIARPAGFPKGPAYIVVEKILGPGEELAADWAVDGTSGYDFMEQVSALIHDPEGEQPLAALWTEFTGRKLDYHQEELTARQDMLDWAFDGQLEACVSAFADLSETSEETAGITRAMLRRAIRRMLSVFPVYRTYGTGEDAPAEDARIRETVRDRAAESAPPGEARVVDLILAWLAGEGPGGSELASTAVQRFQQLSAPIAAKSVEDTTFYRYGPLLSRMDVGFDAARFSMPIAEFHAAMLGRAQNFPHAMLATATHDHKRGEDVRARLAVLSEIPDSWRDRIIRWDGVAGDTRHAVDPADRYMLYQTLFGAWPPGLDGTSRVGLTGFADRIVGWQQKALREAKLRSSWEAPDEAYESACEKLTRNLLDTETGTDFLADIEAFVAQTAVATLSNMLVQAALRCTVPGMPDIYQGCDLSDFSLVDPDNRRPVDYELREKLIAGDKSLEPCLAGAGKLELIMALLARRGANPALFADGDYQPVQVHGPRAGNVIAFRRTHHTSAMLCVLMVRCGRQLMGSDRLVPSAEWWQGTALESGQSVAGLLSRAPVYVD
ncbi:malto-oligosyltrehalose synthase [Hoeflea sp. AS60]|uniref:malto-oligosyltrehalose synthase n=1 Tax=Hoeflea sp. AS60 TaxID=3135780 RepID=UPI00317E0787